LSRLLSLTLARILHGEGGRERERERGRGCVCVRERERQGERIPREDSTTGPGSGVTGHCLREEERE